MPSTLPSSIPDSQLGLSASELHILRQHQQIALSSTTTSSAAPHYSHSTTSSRGRGHARSSASTSRAASAASSAGGGNRLLLDAGSLAVLGSHFERLMGAIHNRVDTVISIPYPLRRNIEHVPPYTIQLTLSPPTTAHSPDPALHLSSVLPRRLLHRRRRPRNRPLPRNHPPDRRARGRIR